MLTTRMGILVSNGGVHMATGFIRHRTTVAARVWTYCISSKVCCTKYAWDLRNSFSNCDGLVDTLSKIRRKPAKTFLLLSHTPCLLLGSVHIEGCRLQREGHAWHYLTRLFAQKCIRMKEFGLGEGHTQHPLQDSPLYLSIFRNYTTEMIRSSDKTSGQTMVNSWVFPKCFHWIQRIQWQKLLYFEKDY